MSNLLRANFNIGSMMGENDQFLLESYYDNGDFAAISSALDRRCFIIGRTGAGKSAAIRQLEDGYPGRVVRITPEDLSFQYLSSLELIEKLIVLKVHLEPFFTALWKHVLIVEIIKHRYGIASKDKKENTLHLLREKLRSDPAKVKSLDYLNEFGEKFWAETDERVREITDNFVEKFQSGAEIEGKLQGVGGVKAGGGYERNKSRETKMEIASRYQKIVNETQLPKLNQVIRILGNEILDSKQHFTYLVVDDLDKEWVDEKLANTLIRCLFQAVLDMQQVQHLKILIALRTNIFQQLEYGAQTRGGQEEKFRGSSLHLQWKTNDLRGLLNQRCEVASRSYGINPPKTIEEMLPRPAKQSGDPLHYVLERTLQRPRDGIQFLNECLRESAGSPAISWRSIEVAEKRYSIERLRALRDEWKDPYLDIDKVFEAFQRKPSRLSRGELTDILDYIAVLQADEDFRGLSWLTPLCENVYAPGNVSWFDRYGPLVKLLYGVAFLGLSKSERGDPVYSYQDEERAQHAGNLRDGTIFVIHKAFWQALDLDSDMVD